MVVELRTALGQLEAAVHDEYLSPHFKRQPATVKGAWLSAGALFFTVPASLLLHRTPLPKLQR